MAKFCPFCGSKVDPDSIYCLNCGKKLPEKIESTQTTSITSKFQHRYEQTSQPQTTIRSYYQPRLYHPAIKAEIFERFMAIFVDFFITGLVPCFGLIYLGLKDSIREGQSFGKGLFNMRVIDIATGTPAATGQSFIRNCLCLTLDCYCCFLVAFIDKDGRRIGDYIAGTIVIKDI